MRPEFKNVEEEVIDELVMEPEVAEMNDENDELAMEPEVSEANDDLTSNELAAEYVRVTCDALNVRKEPYKESEPLAVAEKGALLQKLGDAGDWTKVINASGVEGYCMTLFLEKVGE